MRRITRLLIVDDHRMFSDSLIRLLEHEPDLLVVGVAGTIAEAAQCALQVDPDVVLLDYRLPDGDAPLCITKLRAITPNARVLVMTGLTDDATMAAALEAGCAGIVTKDRAAHDLVAGIRDVAFGPSVNATDKTLLSAPRNAESRHELSPRERDVLVHLATGESTDEIARALHISSVTVRNHVQRILAKLGAHSRLEAVAVGIQANIIAPPANQPSPRT